MRLSLLVFVHLSTAACAQTTEKPSTRPDPARQRADSAIGRAPKAAPPTDAAPADARTAAVRTVEVPVRLGDGTVTLAIHTAPTTDALASPGFETFPFNALNLHDDEGTSVEAALDVIRQRGGRVVELRHSGARNVTFPIADVSFTADPNRMFTDAGRQKTLAALSTNAPASRRALAAFADSVRAVYATVPPAVVVTLHNNTPGGYSARSYQAGGEYASDAAAVTVHAGTDPDDFFFVTDRALYDALAAAGFNAVLQDNAAATDDGSLSVWAAQHDVPYVNVEAAHGHRAEQARMIGALLDVLSGRP